jgi:hypothetical protein
MIEELAHRINSLLARWTAGHNNALTAFSDRWRVFDEMAEIALSDFLLNDGQQCGSDNQAIGAIGTREPHQYSGLGV